MNPRRRLTPQRKKELEAQLAERLTKVNRTGMSARLLKGEDLERYTKEASESINKAISEYTHKTDKEIDKKTQEAIASLSTRIDAVLKYMQSVVQSKVDSMPVPQDGRTPTKEEITEALLPLVSETKKEYESRIKGIEEFLGTINLDKGDTPQDLESLEAFVKSKIPKDLGGGGGPGYFFELLDTPSKSKGFGAPYSGFEGQVVKVSSDGKRLVFGVASGGSLPPGGTTGQALIKQSNADGDADWQSLLGGGDMLASVYDPANKAEQVLTIGDATDFATAAQGSLADTASQPGHTHVASDVTDFQTAVSANSDVVANTAKISFDSTSSSKLAGIEAGAQVNTVTSVATKTGAVTLDTDDVAEATNLYYTEARVSANTDVAANTAARHSAVTLSGTPNYITLVGQDIVRALIDLTSHITGKLPFANLANGSAHSVVGRAGSGSGDVNNITAGNNTVLSRDGSNNVAFNNATTVRTILNVADGATANSPDATLLARANHTGTQAISTVSGLQAELDTKVDYSLVSEASSATPTATGTALRNDYVATALVANATLSAPSGTANANGVIRYRITASGGTRTIGYNAVLLAGGITRATSLATGETLEQIYSRKNGAWVCVYEDITT